MTAFASPLKSRPRRTIPGVGVSALPLTEPTPARVVSVSARWLEEGPPPESPESPVFRPIEDDVQALIAIARREADRLRSSLNEVAAHKMDIDETISRLDERLNLGVQMLRAFQHQIERIEYAVAAATAIEQRNQRLVESLRELLPALDAA